MDIEDALKILSNDNALALLLKLSKRKNMTFYQIVEFYGGKNPATASRAVMKLRRAGLITYDVKKREHSPGKPMHLYHITEKGKKFVWAFNEFVVRINSF